MAETTEKEMKVVFERPHSLLPVVTNFCPGCPHGIVERLVCEVMDELDIEGETIGVAPVGCSVISYDYLRLRHDRGRPRPGARGGHRR